MKRGASVIICTYNPEENIFTRCLNAILKQKREDNICEIIIVDNNSSNAFQEKKYFKEFLQRCDNCKVVREEKQGLAHARIRGYKEAKYDLMIFFDDDNVPADDYVINAITIAETYPRAGVFGAGNIEVEFTDPVPAEIQNNFTEYFQERSIQTNVFSNKIWENFYPPGSGIVVRKSIFSQYAELFNAGKLSGIGRKGSELTSGEDSQIIWTAIKNKFEVGASPRLKLKHLIPARRANINYIEKLQYNISKSFYSSMYEFFPSETPLIKASVFSPVRNLGKELFSSSFNIRLAIKKMKLYKAWLKGHEDFLKTVIDQKK